MAEITLRIPTPAPLSEVRSALRTFGFGAMDFEVPMRRVLGSERYLSGDTVSREELRHILDIISEKPQMVRYRYSADVNGKRRSVEFYGRDGLTSGEIIATYVDNNNGNYNHFYRDATQEDLDAERENDLVETYGWSEVDS